MSNQANTLSAPRPKAAPAKSTDVFLQPFGALETTADRQPAWLLPQRKAGIARFAELGLPTLQHEDWRFTNVAPLGKLPFHPALKPSSHNVKAASLKSMLFSQLPGSRLVFVNGHFARELSTIAKLLEGVKVSSLAEALTSDAALLEKHLGRYVHTEDNAFAALNTAYFQDGGFVFVPAGKSVTEPVQLVFITTGTEATAPRNLVISEAGSRVTVIEHYVSFTPLAHFTNPVTELVVGDNAVVEHIKYQDENPNAFHLATIHGHFGRTSNASVHSFALGAALSRNEIRAKLAGEGLECVLNGLYLTRGEQLADHHMVVEHAQPHCASHEYFNGILDEKSKGVFHGRIYVHPVAQKTDAKQTNKNMLLSDEATADTKPQLEIYADDVKCTHGATIGQLDDDSIFYLRARGIGLDNARRMLIHAFAGEIIDRVKHDAAREELDALIWERLEQNRGLTAKA